MSDDSHPQDKQPGPPIVLHQNVFDEPTEVHLNKPEGYVVFGSLRVLGEANLVLETDLTVANNKPGRRPRDVSEEAWKRLLQEIVTSVRKWKRASGITRPITFEDVAILRGKTIEAQHKEFTRMKRNWTRDVFPFL